MRPELDREYLALGLRGGVHLLILLFELVAVILGGLLRLAVRLQAPLLLGDLAVEPLVLDAVSELALSVVVEEQFLPGLDVLRAVDSDVPLPQRVDRLRVAVESRDRVVDEPRLVPDEVRVEVVVVAHLEEVEVVLLADLLALLGRELVDELADVLVDQRVLLNFLNREQPESLADRGASDHAALVLTQSRSRLEIA